MIWTMHDLVKTDPDDLKWIPVLVSHPHCQILRHQLAVVEGELGLVYLIPLYRSMNTFNSNR
jgi:hypothetical protein